MWSIWWAGRDFSAYFGVSYQFPFHQPNTESPDTEKVSLNKQLKRKFANNNRHGDSRVAENDDDLEQVYFSSLTHYPESKLEFHNHRGFLQFLWQNAGTIYENTIIKFLLPVNSCLL
jgi:hypothetical protein